MRRIASFVVAAAILYSSPEAWAQPPNNEWSTATSVSPGGGTFYAGTTIGATTGSPVGNCGSMGNDVWFTFLASCTGTMTASLCGFAGATFDTVLAGWLSPIACGNTRPTLLACNDDTCGVRSEISFGVVSGRTYLVSVGGFGGATGNFTLWLACIAGAPPPPPNDHCGGATPITAGAVATGTNVGSTTGPEPIGNCGMQEDVWFTFTATTGGEHVVTTCLPGTDFDTKIQVWFGSCGALIASACNDDSCYLPGSGAYRSTVTFNASQGSTYYVSVGGFGGANGYFNLRVSPRGAMQLFFTGLTPGNLGFTLKGGPPNGAYQLAVTTNHGAYPNGWLLGIDISIADLMSQLGAGPPFSGVLDSCGDVSVGPYTGLPSGLTVYGVCAGMQSAGGYPVVFSNPAAGTVQ